MRILWFMAEAIFRRINKEPKGSCAMPPNERTSRRIRNARRRQLSGGAADPSTKQGAEAVKRAETRWSQVRYLPAAPRTLERQIPPRLASLDSCGDKRNSFVVGSMWDWGALEGLVLPS